MLQTSQPGLLRRSSRLKTKNEALQQEVLKWQNKVEKMEVQVKNLKKKLGKKNRKRCSLNFCCNMNNFECINVDLGAEKGTQVWKTAN